MEQSEANTHMITCQLRDTEPSKHDLTINIVTAVADATGSDPLELEPLYEVVDPQALAQVMQGSDSTQRITMTFTYLGFEVTVNSEGDIVIQNRENDTTADDDDHRRE